MVPLHDAAHGGESEAQLVRARPGKGFEQLFLLVGTERRAIVLDRQADVGAGRNERARGAGAALRHTLRPGSQGPASCAADYSMIGWVDRYCRR